MAESKMAEFKMAAIIKLIRLNEWSILCKWWRGKREWSFVFFLEMVGSNLGKCGWVWEEKLRWLNSRWPNWRWLPSSSWVRMNKWSFLCKMVESKMAEFKLAEFKMVTIIKLCEKEWVWGQIEIVCQAFVRNVWDGSIKDGRIQDGWIIKLGGRIQKSGQWPSSSWIQDVRRNEPSSSWVRWMREVIFVQNGWLAKFKMAAIIKLRQNEWVKFFCANGGEATVSKFWEPFLQVWVNERKITKMVWIQDGRSLPSSSYGRIQDGCHHQVMAAFIKWEGMSLSQIELVWFRVKMVGSKMVEFKMAAIIKFENEWVCMRLELVWVRQWLNPRWQNQDGKIQDGCHHQVESE